MRKDDRYAEKPALSGHPLDPSFRYTSDQILLINMTHYENLQDVDGAFQRFGALAKEIPKARAALFDLNLCMANSSSCSNGCLYKPRQCFCQR